MIDSDRRQHWDSDQATVRGGARPGIIFRALPQLGTQRIPFHIANGMPTVTLIQRSGEIPALPQMAGPMKLPILSLRKPTLHCTHRLRETKGWRGNNFTFFAGLYAACLCRTDERIFPICLRRRFAADNENPQQRMEVIFAPTLGAYWESPPDGYDWTPRLSSGQASSNTPRYRRHISRHTPPAIADRPVDPPTRKRYLAGDSRVG